MTQKEEWRPSDQELADWLLHTLRMFGADEANAHRIIALFIDGLNQEQDG